MIRNTAEVQESKKYPVKSQDRCPNIHVLTLKLFNKSADLFHKLRACFLADGGGGGEKGEEASRQLTVEKKDIKSLPRSFSSLVGVRNVGIRSVGNTNGNLALEPMVLTSDTE